MKLIRKPQRLQLLGSVLRMIKMSADLKNIFFGIGLIILLFVASIFIRKDNLSAPMYRYHEWITAHTLITSQIWEENGGPSTYNYNPIYTYPGEGNNFRNTLGGITKSNGEVYYVSYPPFTYIFAYYGMKVLGGTSVKNIRILSLFIHFICSVLLYFIILKLDKKNNAHQFNLTGIIAAGFYIFGEGNLWNHGNLYFADTLIQPIILGLGLMTLTLLEKEKCSTQFKIAFFILVFLAIYTEWLGLFFSFTLGLFALYKWIFQKELKFRWLTITLIIGFVTAIGLTLIQYSSIEDFETLKEVWTKKYTERSGYSQSTHTAKQFNITGELGLKNLQEQIDYNYDRVLRTFTYLLIFLGVLLLFKKNRKQIVHVKAYSTSILFVSIVIGMHYLLFFNFNAMHGFASLKSGILFLLIGALIYKSIFDIIRSWPPLSKTILMSGILFFTVFMYTEAIRKYLVQNKLKENDYAHISDIQKIARYESKEKALFININWDPTYVFYTHHNFFQVDSNDSINIKLRLQLFHNTTGEYYHFENSRLQFYQEISEKEGEIKFSKPIPFNF